MDKFDIETIGIAGQLLSLRRDLWLFRAVYLPVFLRTAKTDLAEQWQGTVQGLPDALPREDRNHGATLAEHRFLQLLRTGFPEAECLLTPPHDAVLPVQGRLRWHIYPYSGQSVAERGEQVRFVLRWAGVGDKRAAAPWLELLRILPAVQEFFASLPPTSDKRMGGYVSVLPILAELDPAFAAQAMDRSRLVATIKDDPTRAPSERARQLSVLGSRFYAGCICNSLVLVLEALANNHFPQIGHFLRLPEIHADGYWSGLMPKVLLATLYRKAVVLRDNK